VSHADDREPLEPVGDRAAADAERVRLVAAVAAAVALVRVYRAEEGPGGAREQACLAEVKRLRDVLSERRRARRVPASGGPGLAKADEERASSRVPKAV